jgi:hypothetical protein
MNVKSPNNTSKWQVEFNSVFKGLSKRTDVPVYNLQQWRIGGRCATTNVLSNIRGDSVCLLVE